MTLTIRRAVPADFAAIAALDSALSHGSPRHEAIRAAIEAGSLHVAIDDAGPVGFAVMTRHFFDRGFVELLMVGANFRRRGHATALLRHCQANCPTDILWTSTNASNAPMRALLAAEGYIASGAVEGLDEGDPELLFRKRVR